MIHLGRPLLYLLTMSAAMMATASPVDTHARLKADASVDGRMVMLGDIVDIKGATPAQTTALQQLALTSAPRPGYTLHLSRREVERLLREAGQGELRLDGAEAITIAAHASPLDPLLLVKTAADYLRAGLPNLGPTLEMTPADPVLAVSLPPGRVGLQPHPQAFDQPRSHMIVRIDITLDGVFYQSVSVPFLVHATQPVLVARSTLSKGQSPGCADLDLQTRDIAQLDAAPQIGDCALAGRRLRRQLTSGEVLLTNMLESMPAVSEGDSVSLQIADGAVSLETRAIALADGELGQRIPVRASGAQEPVQALIVAPHVVTVSGI